MSRRPISSPTLFGVVLAMFAIAPVMAATSPAETQQHLNSAATLRTVSSLSQSVSQTKSGSVTVAGSAAPLPPFPPGMGGGSVNIAGSAAPLPPFPPGMGGGTVA